jgi:hypothetical protein
MELEIIYTNYKGLTTGRRIKPNFYYLGSTEFHPETQWLLNAKDLDKGEIREFALKDMVVIKTSDVNLEQQDFLNKIMLLSESFSNIYAVFNDHFNLSEVTTCGVVHATDNQITFKVNGDNEYVCKISDVEEYLKYVNFQGVAMFGVNIITDIVDLNNTVKPNSEDETLFVYMVKMIDYETLIKTAYSYRPLAYVVNETISIANQLKKLYGDNATNDTLLKISIMDTLKHFDDKLTAVNELHQTGQLR